MLRVIAALIAGLLLCAQTPMLPGFPPGTFQNRAAHNPAAGGGGYTGPLDVSGWSANVVACGSLRACNAAVRGNAVVNVCDSTGGTDVACADLSTDATTGQLVAATVGGGTCPGTLGTNCTVKKLYDQLATNACGGGSCDWIQNTIANRPTLPNAVLGSFAVMRFTTSQELKAAAGGMTLPLPITLSAVSRRTSGTSLTQMFGSTSGTPGLFWDASTVIRAFAGNLPQIGTGTENAWHNISTAFNGASSIGYVDGVSSGTVDVGTSGMSVNSLNVGGVFAGAPFEAVEVIMTSDAKTGTQQANLCTNQFSYWGTSVSC